MANAHRVVMKRDEDEDDELEPQQALPVPDGGYADISCDWKSHVPTTAEEYLRMVRQEASQVPDIVSKPMDSTMSRYASMDAVCISVDPGDVDGFPLQVDLKIPPVGCTVRGRRGVS